MIIIMVLTIILLIIRFLKAKKDVFEGLKGFECVPIWGQEFRV